MQPREIVTSHFAFYSSASPPRIGDFAPLAGGRILIGINKTHAEVGGSIPRRNLLVGRPMDRIPIAETWLFLARLGERVMGVAGNMRLMDVGEVYNGIGGREMTKI